MTSTAPLNLLLMLLFFAMECAVCAAGGELAARWLAGFSLWRNRLFEVSFLLGLAACSLIAYVALVFSVSAKAIPVALAFCCAALWWLGRKRACEAELPDFLQAFLNFRATRAFRFAAGLVLLYVACIGAYRAGWLLGVSWNGSVIHGTIIWDDLRTLGFPLALAAHGFPLRSPIAVEMALPYPLGAFVLSAGWVSWLPAAPLPVLLAGAMTQALFYGLTVLLVAGVLARSPLARLLLTASSLISVSMNLWNLPLDRKAWWVLRFFGYFQHNGMYTTTGWTPYFGMLWNANHALGFASAMVGVIWFIQTRRIGLPLVFAAFSASASMDMSAMAVSAGASLMICSLLLAWIRRRPTPDWLRGGFAILACSVGVLVLVNLPSLRGNLDSPFDTPFPWITAPFYNVGVMSSHAGPYVLLLLAGATFLFRRRVSWLNLWLMPVVTGLGFSFAFDYHSIWFWRFTLAAHLLLSILCVRQLDLMPGVRAARIYAAAWGILLIPGVYQASRDVADGYRLASWRSPEYAAAAGWIESHTALSDRVAEYRASEASLTPDVNFLRTGNRGGWRIYDRSHPLVGYRKYEESLSDLSAAIAWNDFLLLDASTESPADLLTKCGAPVAFTNARFQIFRITETCRARLWIQPLRSAVIRFHKRAILGIRFSKEGPQKLPIDLLAEYVLDHPESVHLLRTRLEGFWNRREFAKVQTLLARLVEADPDNAEFRYSYAFTLQMGRIDLRKAVEQYSEALRRGYAEFWVRYNRGAANIELREFAKARADLRRAQALDPKHSGVAQLLERLAKPGSPSW
jgi:tetratricopeptide (TPR) repeat protein